MVSPPLPEAVITLDRTGRYTWANEAALHLLGVTLAELRASPSDRFAIQPTREDEQAALREAWESGGSPPLVGTAGLRRADGATVRVSYAIEADGAGLRARLRPVEGSPEEPPSVYTVGSVLREWRAAERRLAEVSPDSPEWTQTAGEIDLLRRRYRELFKP